MNFIPLAANTSIPRIYDFCTIFVLHVAPCMIKITVQHTGDTFLILTDLDILTNHSSMKFSSILQMEKNIITTTGTFIRVDYLRLNK